MAYFIQILIVITLNFTILFGWNDDLHGFLCGIFDYLICVEGAISQKCLCIQPVNQGTGFFAISSGTFCNNSSERHTMRIHGQMYLGVEPPFVRLMS